MSTAQQTMQLKETLTGGARVRGLAVTGIILMLIGLAWFFIDGRGWQAFLEWKQQIGLLPFFASMTLLPLVGVPTTPLFVIAGATFGLTAALTGSAISIAANLALSYCLARYVLRQPLTKLLHRWDYQLPRLTPGKALSFLIVMRLAPGMPTFLKNYSTALFDVPFGIYLAVSWTITFLYSVSLIVLGDSLYNHDLREGAAALLILVVVVACFAWINRRQHRMFADGGADKLDALKRNMVPTIQPLNSQTLTLRALKMAAILTLLWGILAQNAGWTFAAEAIIAVILTSLFFAMLLPTTYSFSGLMLFACYFLVETLRGGMDVAWRALSPKLSITPGWINYPLALPQGAPQVLFLNCVSLLPGTLSVALQDNAVVVHNLNTSDRATTELARLEYWVLRVFAAPGRQA